MIIILLITKKDITLPNKKLKKIQTLKPAHWSKRLLAYAFDNLFLFIILVFFIYGLYGQELVKLLNNITQQGAINLLAEANLSNSLTAQMNQLSTEEQNMAYWMYVVQNKYSRSIFILSQILSSFYFGLFWWSTGQTIGAKLLNIRVISPLNPQIPLMQLFIRVVTLKLVETAWGLPLIITTNPILKQRIHDSLSNTVVVEDFSKDTEEQINEQISDTEEITDFMSNHKD